jgi:large subunit ribosomal protein L9
MKVILTAKVRNLGNVGDIVEVKNGYGRNFLIPEGKAIVYSDANYKIFEKQKQKFEEENAKNIEVALTTQKKLENKKVILIESASEDGKLYGSISTTKLAAKINSMVGADSVKKSQLIIKHPIKNIGEYTVTLALHAEVTFNIDVIVATSDTEVSEMMKRKTEKSVKKEKAPKIEKEEKEEKAEKTEKVKKSEEKKPKKEEKKKSDKPDKKEKKKSEKKSEKKPAKKAK